MERQIILTTVLKDINRSIKALEKIVENNVTVNKTENQMYAAGVKVGVDELYKILNRTIENM